MDQLALQPAPVKEYARLLRELRVLMNQNQDESDEGEAIRDDMDRLWYAMTDAEQERMDGLSADLYALDDASLRPPLTELEQIRAWRQEARRFVADFQGGNFDAALVFLRKPAPAAVPPHFIPFLQGLCWEKLGDPETAAVFMLAAGQADASPLELATIT